MTTVQDVGDACSYIIFGFLSARDCAVVSCACRYWRQLLSLDSLWQEKLSSEYHCHVKSSLAGLELPTFKAAFADRGATEARYPYHFRRAAAAWSMLEAWLAANHPPILQSLSPGASEADLDAAESALGTALPDALRAIYRIHNGQTLNFDLCFDRAQGILAALDGSDPSLLHGLFGGYLVYDNLAACRFLPLHRVVRYTCQARNPGILDPSHIMFAANFLILDKFFAVNTDSGDLFCNAPGHRCHPPRPADSRDGVLSWLEEFARRLDAGAYIPERLSTPTGSYLSVFPVTPPQMTTAVTRGVRVQASAVYVPSKEGSDEYYYSIRMRLLPEEEQQRGFADGDNAPLGSDLPMRPLKSAQLLTRHWRIHDGDAPMQVVSGEGVIGDYPLLVAGGPEYVYQSRTIQTHAAGFMEGHFVFVEGSIQTPEGPEFVVACPRFDLQRPDYIY